MKAISPSRSRIVLALILCASLAVAQESDEAKKVIEADRAACALRDRIMAEAGSLPNHPWAGEYHCGDGLIKNQSLFLAPEAGFLIEWSGCIGLYYRNYGPVKEIDGGLKLCFSLENKGEYAAKKGLPDEYVFVEWKPSQYLVPANDMREFCNMVNKGDAPSNQGSLYFLRGEYGGGYGSGMPQVPEQFQSYLLATPVTAEIVSVEAVSTEPYENGWVREKTTVTLNAGRDKGLQAGMRLYVKSPGAKFAVFGITTVGEKSSQASTSMHRRQFDKKESGPEKGWRLSTR